MMTLSAALVLIIAHALPLWASALCVAALFGVVAYVVAQTGFTALKNMDLTPTETIASLKDNKSWVTKQLQ